MNIENIPIPEEFREVAHPIAHVVSEHCLEKAEETYGALSDEHKEMVKRVAFTVVVTMLQTHLVREDVLGDNEVVTDHWEEIRKNNIGG